LATAKEPFSDLLHWLDPDADKAGRRYEEIRANLIRLFVSKGFSDSEHKADEAFDRVMKRLPEIRSGYVGNPARYFVGVARNLILEGRRNKEVATDVLPECLTPESGKSDAAECLLKCLKSLPPDKRELILDYHVYQGHAKIVNHREMAEELRITEGALRTRAHHIRTSLEQCVRDCIDYHRNKSGV